MPLTDDYLADLRIAARQGMGASPADTLRLLDAVAEPNIALARVEGALGESRATVTDLTDRVARTERGAPVIEAVALMESHGDKVAVPFPTMQAAHDWCRLHGIAAEIRCAEYPDRVTW